MPGPYEIIKARVMQKKATEAEWLAVEDELGVILDGEQAFVVNDSGVGINFKIGDGTKKFSELPYFITFSTGGLAIKKLSFINQSINVTVTGVFRNLTCLYDIIFINNSGSDIDLKLGTTNGGNELVEIVIPNGVQPINLRKVFQADTTLYFTGLTGKNYTMFLMYYQYDEDPALFSGGSGFAWPRCFKGMFEPLNDTDLDANWDFSTGLGREGTPWANCAISGTMGTEPMDRFYPVGWKVGDSLRPATTFGSSTGLVTIQEENIPTIQLKMFTGAGPAGNLYPGGENSAVAWSSAHTSGNQDYDMKKGADSNPSLGVTSSFGQDVPTPFDVRPKSKVVLFFVAITD